MIALYITSSALFALAGALVGYGFGLNAGLAKGVWLSRSTVGTLKTKVAKLEDRIWRGYEI